MKAEIVSVGTELLLGSITDTNAGGITVDGSLTASGADNFTLNASAGNIVGGAGRLTTTGAVTLSGTRVGTAANPVLLNLGGSGTITITTSGLSSVTLAGTISFTYMPHSAVTSRSPVVSSR